MAKTEAAPAADEAPPKKSKKLLIIILILVILLLIGALGFVSLLLLKKSNATAEETATPATTHSSGDHAPPAHPPAPSGDDSGHGDTVDLSHPPSYFSLEPFVVNLTAKDGDRYLQVAIDLQIVDEEVNKHLGPFKPTIRHKINLLLASKKPDEISTREGREALAQDIANAVNTILGHPPYGKEKIPDRNAPVRAVLFNSFIIQ